MNETTDALEILADMFDIDPVLNAEESAKLSIAAMVYKYRTSAGLDQRGLARLVGTTQSVVARIEDADYNGDSLNLLIRIAHALRQKVDIRFVPIEASPVPALKAPRISRAHSSEGSAVAYAGA